MTAISRSVAIYSLLTAANEAPITERLNGRAALFAADCPQGHGGLRMIPTRLLGYVLMIALGFQSRVAVAQVNLYGEPGTFGSITSPLPSGETLTVVPYAEYNVTKGRAAFFSATTSDGTMFSAGFHQNTNNLYVTSCYMSITCLNPTAATCYDAVTGQARNSSEILVLTRDGHRSIPRNEELCLQPSTRFTILAGGVDITDLQTVQTSSGEELVAFGSTLASLGNSDLNGFPMLGFLRKQDGAWRLDSTRQFWRDDVANSSLAGQEACPGVDCGGFGELAFFSQSRTLVYGTYFPESQRVVVIDLDGVVQAQYQVPHPANRCTPEPSDVVEWLGVRQVDTDPTSLLGDERVVIGVDGSEPFAHVIQEFRYDHIGKSIVPVTNLLYTSSGSEAFVDCATITQNANYDTDGNMIVNWMVDGEQAFHVFMKNPVTGRRSIEDNCPFFGYTEAALGAPCLADLSTGAVVAFLGGSSNTPRWDYGGHSLTSSESDPLSRVIARVNGLGVVDLLDTFRANQRTIYVSYEPISLSVSALPRTGHVDRFVQWKGALDTQSQSLWVPMSPVLELVDPSCTSGIFCDQYANFDYPSWLFEVKYDEILDAGVRVQDAWIDRSAIDSSSSNYITFGVRLNTQSTARSIESGFWIFPKAGAEPVLVRQISRENCGGGECEFRAKFRQNLLAGESPGDYRWSLVYTSSSTLETVHAQGVISVN